MVRMTLWSYTMLTDVADANRLIVPADRDTLNFGHR
jgi:hypothetical protein